MGINVFELLTDRRRPYIDHYLRHTGIELATFIQGNRVGNVDPMCEYKRIVHRLLVAYLKRCLADENDPDERAP